MLWVGLLTTFQFEYYFTGFKNGLSPLVRITRKQHKQTFRQKQKNIYIYIKTSAKIISGRPSPKVNGGSLSTPMNTIHREKKTNNLINERRSTKMIGGLHDRTNCLEF